MIRFLGPDDLERYRVDGDALAAYLGDPRARGLTGEMWLEDSEPKRLAAWAVYEPLLASRGLRVLDVGAGFSSLSFALAQRHDYLVAELAAHDEPPPGIRVFTGDWWDLPRADFDVVVAADVFPNVDQRLDAFLGRYTGAAELRMTLTCYPDRWYRTRRTDADEILTMRAWDWEQTARVVRRHYPFEPISPPPSLFANGRQVCLLTCG